MKNLRKFENFDGFTADEEADQMKNDQIFADREAQDLEDAQAFGGQESEEEENLELEDFVDRVLAAIEECGEDCDEEEKRSKVRAVLADFHAAQESQEEGEEPEEDEELGYEEHDGAFGEEPHIEDEEQYERKSLKRFGDFK
jgi:hypothetical protein